MNEPHSDIKKKQGEEGFVLALALFTILLLSVIGISATTKTTLELQIAQADRAYNSTFYQADAGVQYVLARIRADLQHPTSPVQIGNINPASYTNTPPAGFSFQIIDPTTTFGAGPDYKFTVTGTGQDNSETSITVTFQVAAPLNPAFDVGILTDGNLLINGGPNITGSMHANGNISQKGKGIIDGNVSAVGSVAVGSVVTGDETPGADPMEVPQITADDFNALRTKAQSSPNIYADAGGGTHSFGTSGVQENLEGKIIFVDGNVEINGRILNGSIIATGNITVNGASEMTGSEIGVAIAAGGNIYMNGTSDSYGLFWSNGAFVQNGSSTVHGSIVSTGDITRNGSFNFHFGQTSAFDFLPTGPPRPAVLAWIEG